MSEDLYKCIICGKKFNNLAKKQCHQEICGVKSLNYFVNQKTDGKTNASFK